MELPTGQGLDGEFFRSSQQSVDSALLRFNLPGNSHFRGYCDVLRLTNEDGFVLKRIPTGNFSGLSMTNRENSQMYQMA
jgi:hypothetical protein